MNFQNDFPVYKTYPNLAYLDSAASSQKPSCVIDAMTQMYQSQYANVHRGLYQLSEQATIAYEAARQTVAKFLGALEDQLVFTPGTTASINLVAQAFLLPRLKAGDEILVSRMEHHANIVPWYRLCEQTGAKLIVIECDELGQLDLQAYAKALESHRVKMVALVHVSNVLGTINPIASCISLAKARGVPILVDGAQATAHMPVNVAQLGVDFYVTSAHKMYGPTGIGALYIAKDHFEDMMVYQTGGNMILEVDFDKVTYMSGPPKFEAGTPHIVGAIGFAKACDYLSSIGWNQIMAHEQALLAYLNHALASFSDIKVVGKAASKIGVVSFVMDRVHPHDIASILDHHQVCIRAGHHCAMPLVRYFGYPALSRISLGLNNVQKDIDQLITALDQVRKIFA
ncbi:MAG: cysteine desulfurase [Gammaproteobacteria bacterium]|nr:cysteine desulfurase [Gammaproteobacteria bacterium]